MYSGEPDRRLSLEEFEFLERACEEEAELKELEAQIAAEFGGGEGEVVAPREELVAAVRDLVQEESKDITRAKHLMMELHLRENISIADKCFKASIVEVNQDLAHKKLLLSEKHSVVSLNRTKELTQYIYFDRLLHHQELNETL
jgi:hypothetical protein